MPWRNALLRWYDRHGRDLPWRRTTDPWAILVSEVMLQQTRVDTVLPRYAAFMARFPTPQALGAAPESEVLAAWAGLGYYRRARNLQEAARALAARRAFPAGLEGWRELPGVGEYTAAAVAAIAQGEPVVAVDGNVDRVLSRLAASAEPSVTRRRARWRETPPVPGRAGDFLQALFDLGATLCTPRAPRCGDCPVVRWCAAARTKTPTRFPPVPAGRTPRPLTHVAAAFHLERGRLRLVREEAELLRGLWALPHAHGASAAAARRALAARVPLRGEPIRTYRHRFTHREWEVRVYRAAAPPPAGRAWPIRALPAMAAAWRKALAN